MNFVSLLVVLLTVHASLSQRLFKAFNTTALTKYRADLNKESSDFSLNVGAALVPREDLGLIEGMCVNRTDVDYFRDPTNVKFRCDVVFRCERPGRGFLPVEGVSGIRLVRVQCPSGNMFTCSSEFANLYNCSLLFVFVNLMVYISI
jgi:hypothetical protein